MALSTLSSLSLFQQDGLQALLQFMQQGGQVLWWLAAVVMVCWLLIIERMLFLLLNYPKLARDYRARWQARRDHDSWYARQIRDKWLGELEAQLYQHLSTIKVLVAICPMLGLLGTVTGMIAVFDVMATQGSSDPKLMASGISLATLPTMAGMVAALAGLFAHARLSKVCERKASQVEQLLRSQS
ncbi:MotA/TolQ/ExbB proton channel family protein [Vibrio sp. SM6]|uniref:MotA/TolQ/ExbB proton channel family protein n=1 Tax=Vibrio agarilyticus TaxID=2726741 RepID=A0A7X8TP17_9VIBR|nr:MotA/TolQ/ExbB proton channel family protein [Vibrio agarilyticus]NLS12074.1 MotA/TolQ/ExbB proton channel family protein [Vibrio agarilyticus]